MADSSAPAPRPIPWRMIVPGLLIAAILLAALAFWLRLRGIGLSETAIAEVMPARTAFLLELDLLQLNNPEAVALNAQIQQQLGNDNIDPNDPASLVSLFDENLRTATGLTFSEDILPWLGPRLGIAIMPSEPETMPQWIMAASVRDEARAEQFIDIAAARLQDSPNQNRTLLVQAPIITRRDDLILIASSPTLLSEIETGAEASNLAGETLYQEALSHLPERRGLTIFLTETGISGLLDTLIPVEDQGLRLAVSGLFPAYTAVAAGGRPTSEGLQFDLIGLHDELSESQVELLAAQTSSVNTAALLPASTTVYLRGQRLDLLWQELRRSLGGFGYQEEDITEAAAIFSELFGFDPETDLMAALDDEYAFALLPAEPVESDILNVVGLTPLRDADAVRTQAEAIKTGLNFFGIQSATEEEIVEILDLESSPILSYHIHDHYLIVGSQRTAVKSALEAADTLSNQENFRTSWASFPEDAIPVMFVAIGQISSIFPAGLPEAENIPFSHAALAASSSDELSRSTLILFLNKER